jgi:hypothetical protein
MNVLTKAINALSAIGGAMSGVVSRVLHPGPRHSPHQRRFRTGNTRAHKPGTVHAQGAKPVSANVGVNSLDREERLAVQPQRRELRPARNCKKLVLTSRRERS